MINLRRNIRLFLRPLVRIHIQHPFFKNKYYHKGLNSRSNFTALVLNSLRDAPKKVQDFYEFRVLQY